MLSSFMIRTSFAIFALVALFFNSCQSSDASTSHTASDSLSSSSGTSVLAQQAEELKAILKSARIFTKSLESIIIRLSAANEDESTCPLGLDAGCDLTGRKRLTSLSTNEVVTMMRNLGFVDNDKTIRKHKLTGKMLALAETIEDLKEYDFNHYKNLELRNLLSSLKDFAMFGVPEETLQGEVMLHNCILINLNHTANSTLMSTHITYVLPFVY